MKVAVIRVKGQIETEKITRSTNTRTEKGRRTGMRKDTKRNTRKETEVETGSMETEKEKNPKIWRKMDSPAKSNMLTYLGNEIHLMRTKLTGGQRRELKQIGR